MATIKEIKEELAKITDLESPFFKEFEKDSRSGVQKEIEKRKKAIQAEMDENLYALKLCFDMKKNFTFRGLT